MQDGGIDHLQDGVGGSLRLLLDACYGRCQRVRCNVLLYIGRQQGGLEQLTVCLLLLSLVLYLLQMSQRLSRQVLVASVLHLFPQCLVCLCERIQR